MRGKYICLEGNDNSGKSTLANALHKRLEGSHYKRFPSDGHVGKLIRSGLMGQRLLSEKAYLYLFAADGLVEERDIQEILNEGSHVICDRHPTLSGRVYQPRHHSLSSIEDVYSSAADDGISMPDHLFIIEVSAEESLRRGQGRDKYDDVVFESEKLSEIEDVNKRYRALATRFGGKILDGHQSIDELIKGVLECLD